MRNIAVIAVLLVAFAAIGVGAQTRIKFARGAKKATVSGTLSGYRSKRVYVVRLRAGQRLRIETTGLVTISVTDPAGEDPMDRDMSCNGRADISPTLAGDYRIEVFECQKAEPWRGRFRMSVRADRPARSSSKAGDSSRRGSEDFVSDTVAIERRKTRRSQARRILLRNFREGLLRSCVRTD